MCSLNSGGRFWVSAALLLAIQVGGVAGQGGAPAPINLEASAKTGSKAWAPRAAADAPIEAARVRIVDFGNDFLRGGDGAPRHHFHCHRYALVQNTKTGLWEPCARPVALDNSVDVDGDGKLDDVVAYHEFSLDRPFNPVAPWYDTLAGTPRWYGGQAIYQANTRSSGFSEDGVNQDHDGQFAWPRENWAVFHETYETYGPYRLAANWLWLRHDFLNGGSDGRVTFDEHSRLALLLKRYFMCVDSVRFLVRDGEQCYLSEATFRHVGTHSVSPTKTGWAKYDPRTPHDIYFDAAQAKFEPHEFTDVKGVGVYCSKDRFLPSYFGYKWYSFECDAVVHRRCQPSQNIDMTLVTPGGGAQPFYMSRTEVPYELWKTVFRQARSNNFVPPSQGFGFEKDGDMGSMDFGDQTHSLQEPATDFTLHDAAAWCNALSELEGRTPVYCEDAALTRPVHEVRRSPAFRQPHSLPKLHVKWAADGYRLPTRTEWQLAAVGQQPTNDNAVIAENSHGQTQPVATKKPNAQGLYDMLGNVWELVWTFGDCYDPEQARAITVLGGDFLSPSDPATRSAKPHGDQPYEGSYNIGLRLVRREAGDAAPSEAESAPDIPAWVITKDFLTKAVATPTEPDVELQLVAIPGTDIEMAATETTYRLWKQVRDWGIARGYETDYDGDMGSMDYWGFDPATGRAEPPPLHRPDEPVTDITVYDMAVWCNALSELRGRRPIYYADRNLQQVYRKAVKYRPVQFHFPEDYIDKYGKPETEDTRAVPMGAGASAAPAGAFAEDATERVLPSLYRDPSADGFRLPAQTEFLQAALPDNQKYPWGDNPQGVFQNAWFFDNAAGTTHPVGQQQATALGLHDLFGNVSELSNPPAEGEKRPWRLGGSFVDLTVGEAGGQRNGDAPPPTWPYCDTGFRVVRQIPQPPAGPGVAVIPASYADARQGHSSSHPKARMKDEPPAKSGPLLTANAAQFDSLQGKVHRANLYRNGEFVAKGIVTEPRIKWSFKTDGAVKSSPVVVDNLVCFGSYDGCIYALNATTGKEAWKYETGDRVSGSAAVVDGVVYLASEDGYLYALDVRDGALQWKTQCGARMAGSPAVAYGVVFIGSGNRCGSDQASMTAGPIAGLDAQSGQLVWESAVSGGEYLAAVCLDATRVFSNGPQGSNVVALATGAALGRPSRGWIHQNRGLTDMVRWQDLLIVPGSMKGSLCVHEITDPTKEFKTKELWKVALSGEDLEINNGGECGYEILTTPAVSHGRLFAGCNDGKLRAFDVRTGRPLWQFQTNGPIQSSPSVAGQTVYFGCWDGYLYALNAADGALCWKLNLGHMPQIPVEQYKLAADEGGRIISSPWPGDEVIYVGCDDGCMYAVESKAGVASEPDTPGIAQQSIAKNWRNACPTDNVRVMSHLSKTPQDSVRPAPLILFPWNCAPNVQDHSLLHIRL
jgi:outer membrane protein assembly factor BamB/formylglycine-generating enzyme required for sulfatase activity